MNGYALEGHSAPSGTVFVFSSVAFHADYYNDQEKHFSVPFIPSFTWCQNLGYSKTVSGIIENSGTGPGITMPPLS